MISYDERGENLDRERERKNKVNVEWNLILRDVSASTQLASIRQVVPLLESEPDD